VVGLLAGLVALSGGTASAVGATVTHVVVTPSDVSPDGLSDAAVTVQVDLDEPRGTPQDSPGEGIVCGGVCVTLVRSTTSNAFPPVRIGLSEVPGTRVGSTATYRGTWLVTSSRSGTWQVGWLLWAYSPTAYDTADLRSTPLSGRDVTVTSTRSTNVRMTLVPSVVAYGARQWARFTLLTSTGSPLVGRYVFVGRGSACAGVSPTPNAFTDAHGRLAVRLQPGAGQSCVRVMLPSTSSAGALATVVTVSPHRYEHYQVMRASGPAAVKVGTTILISGRVFPKVGLIALQRLVGRTWKTVSTSAVRPVGLYTATTRSTRIGRQYLRVVVRNQYNDYAPTFSRVTLVLGTR